MAVKGEAPWSSASRLNAFLLGLVVEYVVICGSASFVLGSAVLLLASLLLLAQILLGIEMLDLRHPCTPWFLLLAGITGVAAIFVGGRNYHASYAPYRTARAGRYFTEIPANASARAYADAGLISFAKGTVVDDTRSVGLKIFGHTYCVAPILPADAGNILQGAEDAEGAAGGEVVQFWAAGLDCCGARGKFECVGGDGSKDAEGGSGWVGGVVLHGPEEGEEAASRTLLAPRIFHEGYSRAIEASSSLYELQSAEDPLLVYCVWDEAAVLRRWLVSTLAVWLGSSLLYCLFALVLWNATVVTKNTSGSGAGHKPASPVSQRGT